MKTRFSFNSPRFLLEEAETKVRYAEAMIAQAEAAAVQAHALLNSLPVLDSEPGARWRVRLLDRLDLVLTSAEGRRRFAALTKEREQ